MLNSKKFRMFLLENALAYWIISKVFPNIEAKVIRKNLEEYVVGTLKPQPESEFFHPSLKIEQIENLQKKEMERNKIIEDKAKLTITGITIAITFLSAGIAIYNGLNTSSISQNKFLSLLLLIIFIISFIYFVLSGTSALKSLGLKEVYDIYLDDELELSTKGESFRISRMVKNLRLNYSITPQREIYLSASYQNVKNGILTLLIGVLLIGGFYIFKDIQNSISKSDKNSKELIQATVSETVDPKTLSVIANGKKMNIFLYAIDIPKENEPFYEVSHAFTKEMGLNKMIFIHFVDDKNKEAVVYLDKNRSASLNHILIKHGFAKVKIDESKSKEKEEILNILTNEENQAKVKKYGIWQE